VAQANVRLTVDATGATRALQNVQNKTNQLQKAFGGLRTAIGGIGLTLLGKNALETSNNFKKLNVRLGLLTKQSGTFARSQQIAADAQKAFGLSSIEALEGITNITGRLAPLNVGVEDIKSTFFGFNTAAKLAGATTTEASNAFRQLAQALGSGRLQGDEFRSISEQIPTILAPIAEELGVEIEQLKKLASESKLTSDVVLRALRKIEKDGAPALQELIKNDPTMVFKMLGNETENLSRAFGDTLAPAVLPIIRGLTKLTEVATNFINSPIGKTAAIFTGIALAFKALTAAATLLAAAKTILIAKFAATSAGAIALAKANATASVATKALAVSTGALAIAMNALPLIALVSLIGLVTTAIAKQNKERKKTKELIEAGDQATIKAEITRLEIALRRKKEQKRGSGLLNEQIRNLEKEIAVMKEKLGVAVKQEIQDKKNEQQLKRIETLYSSIASTIESGLVEAIDGAIKGTKTLGEVASSVFGAIQTAIIQYGVASFLGGLPGGIGKFFSGTRANGGSVMANKSYLVGERGPELFTPSRSGMISSNSTISGGSTNIVVNVDATGSTVEGDNEGGEELGKVLSVAIQSELIKQKRPGGLLA
jgi:tape measure domain-containing protein|tara:strand:+ start:179 stop:1975 length:1797 start_codon:yes stop_codon:yes gene_type:complete